MLKPLTEALRAWEPSEKASQRDPIELLAAGWADIVGADVARHSRPARLAGNTLVITTRSGAWSQQLSLLSEHLLRAVGARLPNAPVDRLAFRVGPVLASAPPAASPVSARSVRSTRLRPAAQTAQEAVARLRDDVDAQRRAKRSQGWKDCTGCGASIAPGDRTLCAVCENAGAQARAVELTRLLFEAPWLGYAGTAALAEGLTKREYSAIRSRLLASWWETLSRAQRDKRLSPDGRERRIASSYVLLRSNVAPEEIVPATVRNVLGDELHDLIYGTEQNGTDVE